MIRLAPVLLSALPLSACADDAALALEECNAELARMQNDRRAYVEAMPDRLRADGIDLAAADPALADPATQEVFLEMQLELDMLENRLRTQTVRCNELVREQA